MTLPMDSQELLRRVDRPDVRGDHEPAINLFANMLAAALNPWFDLALLTDTHTPARAENRGFLQTWSLGGESNS